MSDPKVDFVVEVSKSHNKAARSWKITANGTDHLRAKGF
jgi:hypothetical protein